MLMYLDIVGSCNLQCPSCPMGNSENKNYKKPMNLDVFSAIVKKAKIDQVKSIYLYNWTEPMIHPKIGEFIEIVESSGISCGISSNLNISKNIESSIKANPSFFRISLSGFHQDTYEIGHAGGNIDRVKNNMIYLSQMKQKYQSKTHVEVYYHRYLDNMDDELKMKNFSESLGFNFIAGMSVMMPLEKALSVTSLDQSKISDQDKKIMSRMTLPPSNEVLKLAKNHKELPCILKDNMLTLDAEGDVIICCTVFDQKKHSIGNYLDFSMSEIEKKKNTEPQCTSICKSCMKKGLHVYYQTPPNIFDDYANLNLIKYRVKSIFGEKNNIISFKDPQKIIDEGIYFDELFYLKENPDVELAVAYGFLSNAYEHYIRFGKDENRKPNKFE